MDQQHDQDARETTPPAEMPKKPYVRPEVVVHGTVTELTAGTSGLFPIVTTISSAL